MTGSLSTWDRVLLVLAVLCLLAAPWSWIDDGLTPSWVVFPVAVLVGLYRFRAGAGRLFLAVAATVFLVVHLPWTWAALTGGENPANPDAPFNPGQWLVTLFALPLLTAIAGWIAWTQRKGAHEDGA